MLRVPTKVEAAIQVLLALIVVLLIWDFMTALHTNACYLSASEGCYPWGSEGLPSSYSSKTAYLAHSGLMIATLMVAVLAPMFMPSRRAGIVASIGVFSLAVLVHGFSSHVP